MAELPFPASGGIFEAFVARIRFSPKAVVDIGWLVNCLGITQRDNAGQTLRWLQAAKVIDPQGNLSERGTDLLHHESDERYQNAAASAFSDLASPSLTASIESGALSRTDVRRKTQTKYDVVSSSANKALAGLVILAEASGNPKLIQCLGKPRYARHAPREPQFSLLMKTEILTNFELFTGGTGGIDGWLKESTPDETFQRLAAVRLRPLTATQFNQLLTLDSAPPLSEGFFKYYWLNAPEHTYNLRALPCYRKDWEGSLAVFDLDQLYWGFYRFYVDALLYFGNVREAYQELRDMSKDNLEDYFGDKRMIPEHLISRGPALPLVPIDKDDRYLIAEMACKSYAPVDGELGLADALVAAFRTHQQDGSGPVSVGSLLSDENTKSYVMVNHAKSQYMWAFAASEFLDAQITTESDLEQILNPIKKRFVEAREAATQNTKLYLSAVGELDVYVATSMRDRQDFHTMADFCDSVFGSRELRKYDLRYFDPTLSAAENHVDKGLIECLMVKCAKVLVFNAGDKDSFGKDAEAAMALSLGRPVIFYCTSSDREDFYQDVHPLTRLVNFQTGVAVGAMVTDSESDVVMLLDRILSNTMEYSLEKKSPEYLVLKESVTQSTVRIQTSDKLLRETFWNHYHTAQV